MFTLKKTFLVPGIRVTPVKYSTNTPKVIDELPEWQHPVEKKEIPIELRQMKQAVENELAATQDMVNEIVKNPDYQFYHSVMQYRIEKVEQEILEKKKFNKYTTQMVDKAIEEVVNKTKEEFYHYYKARDERYMALIEERLERLEAGDKEWQSDAVQYLLEGDTPIQDAEEDELKLLTEGSGLNNPWVGADDDEPDTDEIEEPSTVLNNEDTSKWNKELQKIEQNVKQQRFKYDEYGVNDPNGPLYKDYEKMGIYKNEPDNSPYAPVDRIMAHFKSREMEKQKKKEQVSEQEEFEHFMKYLSSDSGARDAFVNLSDEHKTIGANEYDGMIIPDVNNMGAFDKKIMSEVERSGTSPESIQNKKFYDKVQQQKQDHLDAIRDEKSKHIHNQYKPKKGNAKHSRDYRE